MLVIVFGLECIVASPMGCLRQELCDAGLNNRFFRALTTPDGATEPSVVLVSRIEYVLPLPPQTINEFARS
jgi:hypothetical protein